VHCLHSFTSSSDQTGAHAARHVRQVRNIRVLPTQHLAWRPSLAAIDQSPVRATSSKRTVSSRRSARRHVAHTARARGRGVRAPIRRRTDSGQLHCTHGFGPFVSAAAAVTPDPVVVVVSSGKKNARGISARGRRVRVRAERASPRPGRPESLWRTGGAMMMQPNSRALLVAVAGSHHHLGAGLVFYLAGSYL
jgi:hypothetical protein